MEGRVYQIQQFCLHNGPGIRTTVYLKGCPLRCAWCHNPESISPHMQIMHQPSRCHRCGRCVAACPQQALQMEGQSVTKQSERCIQCAHCLEICDYGGMQAVGDMMTIDQVMAVVAKDMAFYATSGGGLTISGGEPLMQMDFTRELLVRARAEGIHTCVDTCGYEPAGVLLDTLRHADHVLYDIKDTQWDRHRQYTGVKPSLIHENLRCLDHAGIPTTLRCVLIPEVNMDDAHYQGIAAIYNELSHCQGIELLAYHPLGRSKSAQMGIRAEEGFTRPSMEAMEHARNQIVEHIGSRCDAVRIG